MIILSENFSVKLSVVVDHLLTTTRAGLTTLPLCKYPTSISSMISLGFFDLSSICEIASCNCGSNSQPILSIFSTIANS